MSHEFALQDRLEALGTVLRARPSAVPNVMEQVRQVMTERPMAKDQATLKRRLVGFGLAAALAATVLLAIVLFPTRSAAWSEVARAIQSQPWIRGTTNEIGGKQATMWLAPKRDIWAFELGGSVYFYDGRQKAKYEFRAGDKAIVKLPLGENDAQRVLPTDALSQGNDTIGPWLMGTEKVVEQSRREITEDGKPWIEFQMVLGRGELNHVTLRVDPETRLPVFLLAKSANGKGHRTKWTFDYPSKGPSDIYALGVARDVTIEDRMPADNVQQVLTAMAASRARIGDFRLIVDQSPQWGSSVVYRKGTKWRVDAWRARRIPETPPQNRNWDRWLVEQETVPLLICDGSRVWQNSAVRPGEAAHWKVSDRIGPQDLMAPEGLGMLSGAPLAKFASLVFPDLSPKRGWGFEFIAEVEDQPGCVLLKRSASVTWPRGAVAHEWYTVDPAKGGAVVRAELFTLPADVPVNPDAAGRAHQTIHLEDFERSPQGFWYPTVVRNTMAGEAEQQAIGTIANWHFDFAIELPEGMFVVDGAADE